MQAPRSARSQTLSLKRKTNHHRETVSSGSPHGSTCPRGTLLSRHEPGRGGALIRSPDGLRQVVSNSSFQNRRDDQG